MRAAVLFLLVGCSEYDVSPGVQPDVPHDEDDGLQGIDPSDLQPDLLTDSGTSETGIEIPTDEPDGSLNSPCEGGDIATTDFGELVVMGRSNTVASGTIYAPNAGWYHLYDTWIAESGASQRNESAFFRVQNATDPIGQPLWANCDGAEWVVADSDNDGPPSGTDVYVGTFWLDEGANTLVMQHYCDLWRAGSCPVFHDTSLSSETCNEGAWNSVHFMGSGVCLVEAS